LLLLLLQSTLKYALPGAAISSTYIHLDSDEDVSLMWDEWDDFVALNNCGSNQPGCKLQLFLESGPDMRRNSSSRASSGTISRGDSSYAESLLNAVLAVAAQHTHQLLCWAPGIQHQ
jgi:hypothetical protein